MKTIKDLTVAEMIKWIDKKSKIKTIGEFKELGRQLRDEYNLTDRQAIDILNGSLPKVDSND